MTNVKVGQKYKWTGDGPPSFASYYLNEIFEIVSFNDTKFSYKYLNKKLSYSGTSEPTGKRNITSLTKYAVLIEDVISEPEQQIVQNTKLIYW